MTERSELAIAALALSAAGLVLAAPLLGRVGYASAADAVMAGAAACGVGSFLLAARATVRAARAPSRPTAEPEDTR